MTDATTTGEKLQGSFALVRTSRGDAQWLLLKHRDDYATSDRDITQDDRSVISGVTVEEIGREIEQKPPPRKKRRSAA